jgi:hypothetical protein
MHRTLCFSVPFLAMFVAGGLPACVSASDLELDEAEAQALSASDLATRGDQQLHFAVAGRPDELCVVPKKFPGADYEKDDPEDEAKLCRFDFRSNVAVCPKLTSTNPGVDILDLAGKDKDAVEASICGRIDREPHKKRAKFKQSVTCSYTPSHLAYYHVSRMLGDVLNIRPAVVRTMDVDLHKSIVAAGRKFTEKLVGGPFDVGDAWVDWQKRYANPAQASKASSFFTSDFTQIYGSLMKNAHTKDFAKNDPWRANNVGGVQAFMAKSPGFKAVTDGRPLAGRVPANLAEAAQALSAAKDFSDMIVLDFLLSQQDRYGNIGGDDFILAVNGGEVAQVAASKVDKGELPMPEGGVRVVRVVIEDTDCGVAKTNVNKENGLLGKLTHMSPKTYRHVRWLASELANNPGAKQFFTSELLFTQRDFDNTRALAEEAAATLERNCRGGSLHLDADLDSHLKGENTPDRIKGLCEEVGPPRTSR